MHEAAGFTGRFTAGLRYIESTCVQNPLIPSDALAGVLAGEQGLALANQELEQLVRSQGPGQHLRVPARSRLIDDLLQREIQTLSQLPPGPSSVNGVISAATSQSFSPAGEAPTCQVVSLGSGMCTRPWRLPALASCRVLEVDLPHIARLKLQLLSEAGAQTSHQALNDNGSHQTARAAIAVGGQDDQLQVRETTISHGELQPLTQPQPQTIVSPTGHPGSVANAQMTQPAPQSQGQRDQDAAVVSEPPSPSPRAFPLLARSYVCIGLDLSDSAAISSLSTALNAHGFDPALPTLWALEALLYYMPLMSASCLLCALADLSAPGSRLIATCVDRELLEASRTGVPKGHVFADLWHFSVSELLYDTPAFASRWEVDWAMQPTGPEPQQASDKDAGGTELEQRRLPASTRRLTREWLGAETYVALYGGSELLFVAGLWPGASGDQLAG